MSYALCQGQRYQCVNFDRSSGACNYWLTVWDEGETVPSFRKNKFGDNIFSWTFEYTNGQQCGGSEIKFDVTWKCDETAQPFSLATECGYVDGDECHHEFIVRSTYACVEGIEAGSGSSSSSGGVGTGTLILILALVAFILYCGIGYGWSVYKTEERDWKAVKEHTPQYDFWTYGLCAYTKAGCCVSYEWLQGKMGKGAGEDAGTDYTLDDEYE